MVNPQLMLNWDHQQQYFEQMHLLNAMPSLSPLSTDSKINNQLYHQSNYQQMHQPHHLAHNTIIEKDNNDYVLIKVRAATHFFYFCRTIVEYNLILFLSE